MIKVKGKVFRNLEEQVLFNSDRIDSILATNVLLAQFGIKVIDQVNTEFELLEKYPRTTFQGEYGDAVLVGTTKPYDYYIWTRPFDEETYGNWLNIGKFPLPGPKGDTGLTGPTGSRGQRGNKWYTGSGVPSASITDVIEGDLYLDTTTSRVYRFGSANAGWIYIMGIKGDRGETGLTGAQGPAGPIVDLLGILTSVDQLPADIAEFINTYGRQGAYLIGQEGGTKTVYGLVGPDDDLSWGALGLFAAGSQVFVNGQPVESIEMNQYVKFTPSSATTQLIAYDLATGQYTPKTLTTAATNATVAMRGTNGTLKAKDPIDLTDLTTKKYVDEKAASVGGGNPERYFKNIPLSYREWVETDPSTGEGYDETITEYPKYIELKPGMEFDLVAHVDNQETSFIGLYVDLVGNYSNGATFNLFYNGENDGNPDATHGGVDKYHVVACKRAIRTYPDGIWEDWLVPEITAYYRNGTVKVVYPDLPNTSDDVDTIRTANLRLQIYDYYSPTYYNNFFFYGNTEPNVSLSEIK